MYAKSVTELLFYADKWNIGFVHQAASDLINTKALHQVKWLEEENSDYSADPFVAVIGNSICIYYELLNFWEGKGRICRIENFDFATRQPVHGFMPGNIHLSYPYIFAEGNKLYCIPETAEAAEVALYEVDTRNPNALTKRKTLFTGAPYLDSSIITYNGLYWLFTTREDRPLELLIFYAAQPDGNFAPHAMNPIACSKNTCRSAGTLFIDNGILYRPSQNLAHDYGGSIIINKINRLTTLVFESESLFEILPQHPYTAGLHNISIAGDLIVVDGKRKVSSPIMPVKKINSKIKYLLRRMARNG